ncbi:MAG TPA: DinB family protein [Chloroflexota bacterium]|nr:DinB family protein [Chloroflexota bacterium]
MTDSSSSPANPPIPQTTAELVDLIRRERSSLEEYLAGLDQSGLVAVDSPNAWSIKDHLMHLVAWEEVLLGALAGEPEHVTLGLEESVASTITMDELNELFYRRNRDVPLPTAWEDFRKVGPRVLDAIGRLSDDDLAKPTDPGDPESTLRMDKIRWNTYEHYLDHRGWIAAKRT